MMEKFQYDEQSILQGCDICARPTIIPPKLFGARVGCQHCGGTFVGQHYRTSTDQRCVDSLFGPHLITRLKSAATVCSRLAASLVAGFSEWFGIFA